MVAAVGLAVALTGINAHAAEWTWKVQSLWQPGTTNQKAFERFAANINTMTGGRLEIKTLPVHSVVKHSETLEAVGAGILDGQHTGGAYFAGKEAALQVCTELNGAFENTYQAQLWFEYGGGTELCREAYGKFGVYYVGPVWFGQESMPFNKPLHSIDDFKAKGIKMRSPEGMGAAIWRRIGFAVKEKRVDNSPVAQRQGLRSTSVPQSKYGVNAVGLELAAESASNLHRDNTDPRFWNVEKLSCGRSDIKCTLSATPNCYRPISARKCGRIVGFNVPLMNGSSVKPSTDY